jgi:hypothetical protein
VQDSIEELEVKRGDAEGEERGLSRRISDREGFMAAGERGGQCVASLSSFYATWLGIAYVVGGSYDTTIETCSIGESGRV